MKQLAKTTRFNPTAVGPRRSRLTRPMIAGVSRAVGHVPVAVGRMAVTAAHFTLVVACVIAVSTQAVARQGVTGGASDRVDLNDGVPREVENVTVDQRLGESLPMGLELTDSSGNRVVVSDFFDGDRPVIVTLNYSNCPMLCNVQLNALTESLQELDLQVGEDFQILTLSIDPHEPPERIAQTKRSYVERLDRQPTVGEGWAFCTATQPVIAEFADAIGFRYTYDEKSGEYYHPAMLAFVSPEGMISRYSLEVHFPPDQVKMALVEAGEGKVGGAVDQFLLWCYTYDPDRNSYVPQAWKLMRLGGAVTIAGMLACLLPYWVGRKRAFSRSGGNSGDSESTPSQGSQSRPGGSGGGWTDAGI